MIHLLINENLEEAKKISKNFKTVIESKYTWNAVANKYEIFIKIN